MKQFSFDIIGAGVVAVLTYLLGGFDKLLIALMTFIVIDFITGGLASSIAGKYSSDALYIGGKRKLFIIFAIAIANIFGNSLGAYISIAGQDINYIRDSAIIYYIWREIVSVTENFGLAGVPLPPQLISALAVLKPKSELVSGGDNIER